MRADRDERMRRWHKEWRQLLRDAAHDRFWAKRSKGDERLEYLRKAEEAEAAADRLAVFIDPAFVGRRDSYDGPLGGF